MLKYWTAVVANFRQQIKSFSVFGKFVCCDCATTTHEKLLESLQNIWENVKNFK